MRFVKYLIPVIIALSFSNKISAHAMWIETDNTGIIGKQQEIKIYFGEYSTGDISETTRWFSDLKDFTLVLVSPGKKEIRLSTTATKEYYTANFTPDEEGIYTIVMHHLTKDVYRNMKLDYHSSAAVKVGKTAAADTATYNNNFVSVVTAGDYNAKKNKEFTFKVFNNGLLAAREKVSIIAPNGWEKELYTDMKGNLVFTPLWPGKYMVDYAFIEKTPGEHNGKKYEEVWKIATYMLEVK